VATIRSSAPPPTGAPLPDGGSVRKGRCLRLKREESGKGRNWRYADSNQGHHDFQPRSPGIGSLSIFRINAKNLAASDGNATATLSRPCIHAAPAHFSCTPCILIHAPISCRPPGSKRTRSRISSGSVRILFSSLHTVCREGVLSEVQSSILDIIRTSNRLPCLQQSTARGR
jgi:hypothetical protein